MSVISSVETYMFHTELGMVVVDMQQIAGFDIEDIIRNRAISQARAIQFLNKASEVSVNDTKGARTIPSAYTSADERLED